MAELDNILGRMAADLDTAHRISGVLSGEQKRNMLNDLRYVLLDNIADEIRFDFYRPGHPDGTWFRSVYRRDGRISRRGSVEGIESLPAENIAFDVSIAFTRPFLDLAQQDKDHLLGNTDFDWMPAAGTT